MANTKYAYNVGDKIRVKGKAGNYNGKEGTIIAIDNDPASGKLRILVEGNDMYGAMKVVGFDEQNRPIHQQIPNARYFYEEMIEVI